MKKYKLIKEFPGSASLGTIYKEDYANGITQYGFQGEPEFFEEVKEPEFKVGDWVVILTSDSCSYVVGDVHRVSSVRPSEGRIDTENGNGWTPEHFRLATSEEIKKHLLAEAEKRGFKEGVKFKGVTHPKAKNGFQVTCATVYFNAAHSYNLGCYLYSNNEYIYLDGQWAEIVKQEEPIVIAGYSAGYSSTHVSFGCRSYHKDEVDKLLQVMERFEITYINVDSAGVITLETIRKIRDRTK